MTASADMSSYETARHFMKLSDSIRLHQAAGVEVPPSLALDTIECRYRLDRLLGDRPRTWTDEEWDTLVRLRLNPVALGLAA